MLQKDNTKRERGNRVPSRVIEEARRVFIVNEGEHARVEHELADGEGGVA
jgi:hypothetical protein